MYAYVFPVPVVLRLIGRRGTEYHIFYELLMRISQYVHVLLVYCTRTLLSEFSCPCSGGFRHTYIRTYVSQLLVPMIQLLHVCSYTYILTKGLAICYSAMITQ